MDYLKNARKTRGKEEYYIVQSLQLQPLLCYPRDRRIAVSGANFNRRGAVSGASCLHTQRTNIARPNHIPPVGTLVRASASGGAPSRGPVSMGEAPSRGPQVRIKQRLSTVVAAPCAGLAPSEHTNITLTYTHCRACPFVTVRNQRTINEHQFLTQPTVGTLVRASASRGSPHRVRSPTCQSLIYFWGAYLPCI